MRLAPYKTSRARRRAFSLVYMLAVIPLIAVTLLLVMRGIGSVVHAERVIVQRDQEYSVANVWLAWLRRDAARCFEWSLQQDGPTGDAMLSLQTAQGAVTFRVSDAELVRISEGGDRAAWAAKGLSIRLAVRRAPDQPLLDVVIENRLVPVEAERLLHSRRTSIALGKGYTVAR